MENENIRTEVKILVAQEKIYTTRILKKLAVIEEHKLYSDYGYPSLFKYLVKELKYSEGEAHVRVSATRLLLRDRSVAKKMESGELGLVNAAQVQQALWANGKKSKNEKAPSQAVEEAVGLALDTPTRKAKEKLREGLELKTLRTEKMVLDEKMLAKVDRARAIYGDVSAYETFRHLAGREVASSGPTFEADSKSVL